MRRLILECCHIVCWEKYRQTLVYTFGELNINYNFTCFGKIWFIGFGYVRRLEIKQKTLFSYFYITKDFKPS